MQEWGLIGTMHQGCQIVKTEEIWIFFFLKAFRQALSFNKKKKEKKEDKKALFFASKYSNM